MDRSTSMRLLTKGAEASLYLSSWHGRKAIIKQRFQKMYRPQALDWQIRIYRTSHEPQLMNDAKKAGVPTPTIFLVDLRETKIVMEYIEGIQVKQLLDKISRRARCHVCRTVGRSIAMLHQCGLAHGDLTTSNMIQTPDGKIYLVDFGLSEKTTELESRGVDLHLMKRGLYSTHFEIANECFDAVIEGYSMLLNGEVVKGVLDKVAEIERRGRYVSERRL